MSPTEHMVAWIESSREHYDRLCELYRDRKEREANGTLNQFVRGMAMRAHNIVDSAFGEATRGGDMFAEQWSAADLLDAAKALLAWELEA